jgi:hypothetical protein
MEKVTNQPISKENDLAPSSDTTKRITRRGFIGLAATAGAYIIGRKFLDFQNQSNVITDSNPFPLTGKPDLNAGNETFPLEEINVLDKPDIWVGDDGKELVNKLGSALYARYQTIHNELQQVANDHQNPNITAWNSDEMSSSINSLISELASRGQQVIYARSNNLTNIRIDTDSRYYELSSYVQMLIDFSLWQKEIDKNQFYEQAINLPGNENKELIMNPFDIKNRRLKYISVWNNPCSNWANSNVSPSPSKSLYFLASDKLRRPLEFEQDYRLSNEQTKVPVSRTSGDKLSRPDEVILGNFIPEVEIAIRDDLSKLGLDRSVNSITKELSDRVAAYTYNTEYDNRTEIYLPQELTLEEYRKYKKQYEKLILHEAAGHGLSARRVHLPIIDRLALRDLEQAVFQIADPLRDLNLVFNPKGENQGLLADNEHTIYAYYLEVAIDIGNRYDENLMTFLDEFNFVNTRLTNENILNNLGANNPNESLDSIFSRLEQNQASNKGITKLFADTLLAHKEAIISKRVVTMRRDSNGQYYTLSDGEYFRQTALPLIFGHLLLYHPDELYKSMMPETNTQEQGLLANYLFTIYKRVRAFINLGPSEELLADFFAEALLTKQYGRHSVDAVNKSVPLFNQILSIYKKNNLANLDSPTLKI